jgi:hypothetical protein
MNVVIDGLGDRHDTDAQPAPLNLRYELHRAAKRPVAADDEEDPDAKPFQCFDHLARVLAPARCSKGGSALVVNVGYSLWGQFDRLGGAPGNKAGVAVAKTDDVLDSVAAGQF